MGKFNQSYPKVVQFIGNLSCPSETFLHDRMSNVNYPFWTEFEYFLSIKGKLGNIQEILRKLSSKVPLDLDKNKAWEKWREFRSAQFEITAIFLLEKYFGGVKTRLIPTNNKPTADFEIQLRQGQFLVEAKAQSGQQHGNKHPRDDGSILFDPKDENDLKSWLFEERISSRNGKAMEPMAKVAEKKCADILMCQTDYVRTKEDISSQISTLCPHNKQVEKTTLYDSLGKSMEVWFFQADYPYLLQFSNLKEIWLCNLSSNNYKLAVLSHKSPILENHLKKEDNKNIHLTGNRRP